MALFMVLWIVNATPEKTRQRVAAKLTGHPFFKGGVGIFEQRSERRKISLLDTMPQSRVKASDGPGRDASIESLAARKRLARRLQAKAKALDMVRNVALAVTDDGIRITIHDTDDKGMFARRSDELNEPFVQLLRGLAPMLAMVPNKLVVVGHTDATRYAGESAFANNWSLSSRRALRARQVMLDGGLNESQLFQVSGMGDSTPAVPDNPEHGSNRRVELLLLTKEAETTWRRMFRSHGFGAERSPDGAGVRVTAAQADHESPQSSDTSAN
ncbi:histidine kinase [Pandoraea pulmonicola]|nr:histidine kinase [Pandoraea pulmonicola]